jgi:hypothetical protein
LGLLLHQDLGLLLHQDLGLPLALGAGLKLSFLSLFIGLLSGDFIPQTPNMFAEMGALFVTNYHR